jgi:hypothetical protein
MMKLLPASLIISQGKRELGSLLRALPCQPDGGYQQVTWWLEQGPKAGKPRFCMLAGLEQGPKSLPASQPQFRLVP